MNADEIKLYTCCFFGHRKLNETELLRNKLYNTIEDLIIDKKVNTFLFGSKSQFDDLCHKVVTNLKRKHSHIKRIYVRAAYQHINDSYKDYLLESYEDTYYPEHIENSGKAAYVERNLEMINKSKFCVVYYDENYLPTRHRNSRRDLTDYQPKSGTKIAYEYATKKGLNIINVISCTD